MDFSKYKFVISSGCSYGVLADATFNPFNWMIEGDRLYKEFGNVDYLDIDGDRVISLNVSLPSHGSDWQSDSLIYVVGKLLELGIKSENIYCLVEWSQWFRSAAHTPRHYGLDLTKFDFDKYTFSTERGFEYHIVNRGIPTTNSPCDEIRFFHNYLNIFRSSVCGLFGKIEDRVYIPSNHIVESAYLNLDDDYLFAQKDIVKIIGDYPLENKIKSYFDNILRTQYFLEKNNLSYNFLFMQSTLSDWGFHRKDVFCHPLFNFNGTQYIMPKDKAVLNPRFNPINNPESDIEKIMPEIKSKVDQLNLDNFWFHDSDRFRRGGIDEWTLDNLKETGYVNSLNFGASEILPNQGNHPNVVSYILLWNKVTFNCNFVKVKPEFEKFISEKYWEDYNYDGKSKNMITLSKTEWERITKVNL